MKLNGTIFSAMLLFLTAMSPDVKLDEDIIFFDTFIHSSGNGSLVLDIHGCVFEPEKDSALRNLIVHELEKFLDLENPLEKKIFSSRIRWFLVDNERGKRIRVSLGGRVFSLKKSSPDGHFSGSIVLGLDFIKSLTDEKNILHFKSITEDGRVFTGSATMIAPEGISVISDIDDTVKITNVLDKKELIRNSFILPYRDVPGMLHLYGQWASRGYAFHYVSGSPWQLYRPLHDFLVSKGFPVTSMHLKYFRIKESSIMGFLLSDHIPYKVKAICSIMDDFPGRKFILVGDSGEQDPEVYAEIYRKYRNRVLGVFIRDVNKPGDSPERYEKLFRNMQCPHRVFKDAAELGGFNFE